MNEELNLLLKYPLINVEIINGNKIVSGLLHVNGRDYMVNIKELVSAPEKGYNEYKLETFEKLPELLTICQRMRQKSLLNFLDHLVTIVESLTEIPKNDANSYRRVLQEYNEFTKFHGYNIKSSKLFPDLSRIVVSTVDESGRKHDLEIVVDNGEFVVKSVDLPNVPWPQKSSNLTDLFNNFRTIVENLQDFLQVMEILDHNCVILDPEKPRRQDQHRRIWLGNNLSLLLTISDPLNPRKIPDFKFLGSEKQMQKFREILNKNLESWNCVNDFFDCLLSVLELESFPEKSDMNLGPQVLTELGECCICFSLRFQEKLPEVVCKNESCGQFFHNDCLYEWLISVKNVRIFGQIRGQCPNCEKSITCALPN